jgi:hypothetical protein
MRLCGVDSGYSGSIWQLCKGADRGIESNGRKPRFTDNILRHNLNTYCCSVVLCSKSLLPLCFLTIFSAIRKNAIHNYCSHYTQYATIPCIAMTQYGIHPAMSPQVPCKSKGQHLLSLLVFIGCSNGSNIGLGWVSSLL